MHIWKKSQFLLHKENLFLILRFCLFANAILDKGLRFRELRLEFLKDRLRFCEYDSHKISLFARYSRSTVRFRDFRLEKSRIYAAFLTCLQAFYRRFTRVLYVFSRRFIGVLQTFYTCFIGIL